MLAIIAEHYLKRMYGSSSETQKTERRELSLGFSTRRAPAVWKRSVKLCSLSACFDISPFITKPVSHLSGRRAQAEGLPPCHELRPLLLMHVNPPHNIIRCSESPHWILRLVKGCACVVNNEIHPNWSHITITLTFSAMGWKLITTHS